MEILNEYLAMTVVFGLTLKDVLLYGFCTVMGFWYLTGEVTINEQKLGLLGKLLFAPFFIGFLILAFSMLLFIALPLFVVGICMALALMFLAPFSDRITVQYSGDEPADEE